MTAQPVTGFGDPRWHKLQDGAATLYAELGQSDEPIGLILATCGGDSTHATYHLDLETGEVSQVLHTPDGTITVPGDAAAAAEGAS